MIQEEWQMELIILKALAVGAFYLLSELEQEL